MSNHSELPWQSSASDGIVRDCNGNFVAAACVTETGDWRANAEFIVRACNSHADLLAACKAAIKELNLMLVRSDLVVHQLHEAIEKAEGSA